MDLMDFCDYPIIQAPMAGGITPPQLGTAFLTTDEAGTHPIYKECLLQASHAPACAVTRLTRAFSGRYARGLVNRFMEVMLEREAELPVYPVQNALSGAIRAQAAKLNEPELMSLWAGQGVSMVRAMPVARLLETLVAEWRRASV